MEHAIMEIQKPAPVMLPASSRRMKSVYWRRAGAVLAMAVTLCPFPLAFADPNHEIDTANWIALPLSSIDGFFPTPWGCGGPAPAT